MIYIVKANPGYHGWVTSNLINGCLGHNISINKVNENAHDSLYNKLVSWKQYLQLGQGDYTVYDEVAFPITGISSWPEQEYVSIKNYRSANWIKSAWHLLQAEGRHENHIHNFKKIWHETTGDFDCHLAYDRHNPDYIQTALFDHLNLTPNDQVWEYYNEYVQKQTQPDQEFIDEWNNYVSS